MLNKNVLLFKHSIVCVRFGIVHCSCTHSHNRIADLHQPQCELKRCGGNYPTKWGINLKAPMMESNERDQFSCFQWVLEVLQLWGSGDLLLGDLWSFQPISLVNRDVSSEGKHGYWPTKWRRLDWKRDFCNNCRYCGKTQRWRKQFLIQLINVIGASALFPEDEYIPDVYLISPSWEMSLRCFTWGHLQLTFSSAECSS